MKILGPLLILLLPSLAHQAPAPLPRLETKRGVVTAVGTGPGDKMDIQLDWKHVYAVNKDTKFTPKGDVLGAFLLYDVVAEVTYVANRRQQGWGRMIHPATEIRLRLTAK